MTKGCFLQFYADIKFILLVSDLQYKIYAGYQELNTWNSYTTSNNIIRDLSFLSLNTFIH